MSLQRHPPTGRFAPSPTGPLHQGSLVAALASWLDARAHGGRWLVRIEDVDGPRCLAGAQDTILSQLAACGLWPDDAPIRQSNRDRLYQAALDTLQAARWAYPCACSRRDIEMQRAALGLAPPDRHAELPYPGTCRHGLQGRPARAMRLLTAPSPDATSQPLRIGWADRRLGLQTQNVTDEVGDFVLRRADRLWAYQLAVVVDDAQQGITHVVRGEDLADNTARQIHLQRVLGLPTPAYLHTPLVRAANGEKLSKHHGAQAVALDDPAQAVRQAALTLGLELPQAAPLGDLLAAAVAGWKARWLA